HQRQPGQLAAERTPALRADPHRAAPVNRRHRLHRRTGPPPSAFRFPAPSATNSMKHLASLLLAFVALAASLPAQQQPVRVVATGGRIASNFYTPPAANTAFRHRTPHQLGGPVAEIQIGFMDWMYPYQSETPNNTNDVTIDHAWLERASTGQVVPLT